MTKPYMSPRLQAVVIGSRNDEFIDYVCRLLREYSIDFVLCHNVYNAVIELTKLSNFNVMVVARLEMLTVENNHFLKKLQESAIQCCCYACFENTSAEHQIAEARNYGAFIVREPHDLENVLADVLSDNLKTLLKERGSAKNRSFVKKEFMTTQQEMEALLGMEKDEV
ncbi:MAG: hypothetical protein ACYTE8_04660 [Planctomycetota bacterium]|jgi:hypothetical protein